MVTNSYLVNRTKVVLASSPPGAFPVSSLAFFLCLDYTFLAANVIICSIKYRFLYLVAFYLCSFLCKYLFNRSPHGYDLCSFRDAVAAFTCHGCTGRLLVSINCMGLLLSWMFLLVKVPGPVTLLKKHDLWSGKSLTAPDDSTEPLDNR